VTGQKQRPGRPMPEQNVLEIAFASSDCDSKNEIDFLWRRPTSISYVFNNTSLLIRTQLKSEMPARPRAVGIRPDGKTRRTRRRYASLGPQPQPFLDLDHYAARQLYRRHVPRSALVTHRREAIMCSKSVEVAAIVLAALQSCERSPSRSPTRGPSDASAAKARQGPRGARPFSASNARL
jgi:hypothetical protein